MTSGSIHEDIMPRPIRTDNLFVCCVALAATAMCGAESPSKADSPHAVRHLTGDSFVAGAISASDDAKQLRWQSPLFTRPFDFSWGAVKGVHYPVMAAVPKPTGEYCFELTGGDVLFGSLTKLTNDEAELE